MKNIAISYSYTQSDGTKLEKYLALFEKEIGGIRQPYLLRAGAIDLVTILQIVLSFVAGASIQPLAEKYFEGLLNGEKVKLLGEQHRTIISRWLDDLRAEIDILMQTMEILVDSHITTQYIDHEIEYAIALTFYLGEIPLFVVLNHNSMNPELIRNIPDGVIRVIRYMIENKLPNNVRILQLYFEKSTNRWKYLLAPTNEGFGHWIDQYIDLENQTIYKVDSRRKFLETFRPDTKDELKFLVNPFSENRW